MSMKHGVAVAALAAALGLTGTAQAQDAYATVDLNMRAGPGPEYPIVGAVAPDQGVEIVGCTESGLWCDVVAGGERGWTYSEYLDFEADGGRVALEEAGDSVPVVTYEPQTYWDENYRERPFYEERDRYVVQEEAGGSAGAATGAAGGAVTGAVLGGPVGAIVGAAAGATLGGAMDPPERVRTYVREQEPEPVMLEGEVVVGAGLPEVVELYEVPDYEYRYAYVNRQRVLVEPNERRVVHVFR